jgi:hypothetical protein
LGCKLSLGLTVYVVCGTPLLTLSKSGSLESALATVYCDSEELSTADDEHKEPDFCQGSEYGPLAAAVDFVMGDHSKHSILLDD